MAGNEQMSTDLERRSVVEEGNKNGDIGPEDVKDSELTLQPVRKWIKQWVCQNTILNNGNCFLLKWVTGDMITPQMNPGTLKKIGDKPDGQLYVCSYEGCNKVFTDAGALRKHSHVHGEKQFICHYEGCGKRFVDSSKLKRHFLIHTGEKQFVCPFEGCGKRFSLDFNRRSHMRTHTGENYHTCPIVECGKRFAHENKLRAHVATQHEKDGKESSPGSDREEQVLKLGNRELERPYMCPHEGCGKRYIHEYKLNLHLKKEHSVEGVDGQTGEVRDNSVGEDSDELDDLPIQRTRKKDRKGQKVRVLEKYEDGKKRRRRRKKVVGLKEEVSDKRKRGKTFDVKDAEELATTKPPGLRIKFSKDMSGKIPENSQPYTQGQSSPQSSDSEETQQDVDAPRADDLVDSDDMEEMSVEEQAIRPNRAAAGTDEDDTEEDTEED